MHKRAAGLPQTRVTSVLPSSWPHRQVFGTLASRLASEKFWAVDIGERMRSWSALPHIRQGIKRQLYYKSHRPSTGSSITNLTGHRQFTSTMHPATTPTGHCDDASQTGISTAQHQQASLTPHDHQQDMSAHSGHQQGTSTTYFASTGHWQDVNRRYRCRTTPAGTATNTQSAP